MLPSTPGLSVHYRDDQGGGRRGSVGICGRRSSDGARRSGSGRNCACNGSRCNDLQFQRSANS